MFQKTEETKRPQKIIFTRSQGQMSKVTNCTLPEQLSALKTYYIYDFKVLKSGSEFTRSGLTYEYACPRTYYKDGTKETDTGEYRTIKGLRSMFKEGHRTFRITKVHEGKSTQFRNYVFTPLGDANPELAYK